MNMHDLYSNCRCCPRACGVDRLTGVRGFCGEHELRIAFAGLHLGEEPPLVCGCGSGTIFISGCNLGCIFCQNYQISSERMGRAVSVGEFAGICLELQNRGAANINIVTGSHAVPAIVQGLAAAQNDGLRIPILWNSSGYDSPAMLELLKDYVDVYLPDLKTLDSRVAAQFFNAPDYPQAAAAAILKMIEYRPLESGAFSRGVIIRHLILPGYLDSSRAVLRWFADHARGRALLSLMTQYTPMHKSGAPEYFLNERDYETVLGWLAEFGIEDGFCQELVTGSDWLPDFQRINPFSSELSVPVWHWHHPPECRSPGSGGVHPP